MAGENTVICGVWTQDSGFAVTQALLNSVYSIADAAQEIGCSEETLRNWDRDGKLPALRDRNNERRYRPEDIERGKKILQKRPSRI